MTAGAVEQLLREWLPRQRWFAGKDLADLDTFSVAVRSRATLLDGDPALLHLLVEVESSGRGSDAMTYQVLLGVRAALPPHLEHARVGHVDGLGTVYEAAHDQDLTRRLLEWIDSDAERGDIIFRREPGAGIDLDAPSLMLSGEQSNTSIVFGEQSILKVFRIVAAGTNPDLEITRALTEAGNQHVAQVQGWIETDVAGVPTTLGMLQRFLRSGSDGWVLALTSVRDLFAEADLHAEEVGGDFAAEAERLGMATADVHLAMASVLPTGVAQPADFAAMAAAMRARLDAAAIAVPALAGHAPAISEVFDALSKRDDSLPIQRVHGDYHLGQVLRTDAGWVLLDFEGEPGEPIDARAALSSTLRDVAGMLRSFDYASRYLLADQSTPQQLEYRAAEWAERNSHAFCVGYAKTAGYDPREDHVLLRAYELDKAVYEVVYEARNRPDWLTIPLGSIERLLAA
jgi:maltokinase